MCLLCGSYSLCPELLPFLLFFTATTTRTIFAAVDRYEMKTFILRNADSRLELVQDEDIVFIN